MTSVAFAAPMVEIRPSESKISRSDFAEDHLILILKNKGEIRDTHYFYSSYGKADAKLIKDAKGTYFVLLRHGEGRGSHVRCEYISIFKILKTLNKVVTFPLNGPAGRLSDWEYSYVLNQPQGGGLEFTLELKVTGGDAKFYPEDKTRVIYIK